MKKINSVLIGLIAGLISVLVIDQLFKWFVGYAAGGNVHLLLRGITLSVELSADKVQNFFLFTFIIISPFIFSLILVEISLVWLGKVTNDHHRSSIIIFQLINVGYLIFAAVMGIISVLLKDNFSTEWSQLLNHGDLSYNQKLIFMFLIMFILLGYINILTKRIRKSIPVINKRRTRK